MKTPPSDMCPCDRPPRSRLTVVTSISQGARDHQEDACGHWFDPAGNRLFAVVADGAGGHGGGAEASRAAIQSAAKAWERHLEDPSPGAEAFLVRWLAEAHLAVNGASAKIQRSARAVVVACHTEGRRVDWVHAGDCRLLRFHRGQLVERTRDDSVVQVLFERGDITEEEMGTHPDQSRLLQSLGGEEPPTPRRGSADLGEGDVLILCSDGFWEHLRTEELEKLASTPSAKRQPALDRAVALAVNRGGAKADNTTAVVIAFDGGHGGAGLKVCRGLPWVLAATVVFAACWLWVHRSGGGEHCWQQLFRRSGPAASPVKGPAPAGSNPSAEHQEEDERSSPPPPRPAEAKSNSKSHPEGRTPPTQD